MEAKKRNIAWRMVLENNKPRRPAAFPSRMNATKDFSIPGTVFPHAFSSPGTGKLVVWRMVACTHYYQFAHFVNAEPMRMNGTGRTNMHDITHWLMPSGLLDPQSPLADPFYWVICAACFILLREFLKAWLASCLAGFVYRIILSEVNHLAGRAPIHDIGDFLQVVVTCAVMLALLKAARAIPPRDRSLAQTHGGKDARSGSA